MNEFDETEEEYDDGRPHPMHRLAKILGPIFIIACLLVTVLLLFRICSQNRIPDEIETVAVNDALLSAYAEKGEELPIIYQDYDTYSHENDSNEMSLGGVPTRNAGKAYFAVPTAIFIPDAMQAQLVLRYNNSTLKYLSMDFPTLCPEIPPRDADVFDITLVKVTDLTPNNSEDNDDPNAISVERFPVTDVKSAEKGLHNFRRLTFENFDLEDALRVYLCIYYKGCTDYTAEPYATVTVYESHEKNLKYQLTDKDIKALGGAQ